MYKFRIADNIQINHNGVVTTPNLHDGHLIGLTIVSEQRILILIKKVDGKVACLMLNGVERFRADEFMQGNIVLDMTIATGANVKFSDISDSYDLKRTDKSVSEKILDRFKQQELIFVSLNPSYGCFFTCVCSGIELVTDWASEYADLA